METFCVRMARLVVYARNFWPLKESRLSNLFSTYRRSKPFKAKEHRAFMLPWSIVTKRCVNTLSTLHHFASRHLPCASEKKMGRRHILMRCLLPQLLSGVMSLSQDACYLNAVRVSR